MIGLLSAGLDPAAPNQALKHVHTTGVGARLSAGSVLAALVVFLALTWATLAQTGPFRFFGIDFVSYYTAGRLVADGRGHLLYDVRTQQDLQQELLAPWGWDTRPAAYPLLQHPPAFALLFVPLVQMPLLSALIVWEVVIIGAAILALAMLLHGSGQTVKPGRVLVLASFFPLLFALFYGQPLPLLLLGLTAAYLAWKRGDDGWAGLAASSLLILKFQYAPPLILVLLLHRRWRALAGVGIGSLVVLFVSLAVVGAEGMVSYVTQLIWAASSAAGEGSSVNPAAMVGWRGLLATIVPQMAPGAGLVLAVTLAAATLSVVLLAWRGPWAPNSPRFDRLFLALLLATLLSAIHSHIHGLALLLIPGVFLYGRAASRHERGMLLVGFALPSVLFLLFPSQLAYQAAGLTVSMLAALGLILIRTGRFRSSAQAAEG